MSLGPRPTRSLSGDNDLSDLDREMLETLKKQNQEINPGYKPNVEERTVALDISQGPSTPITSERRGRPQHTNKIPEELQAPPPISPAQIAKVKRTKGEDKLEEQEKAVYTGKPRFILKDINRNPVYKRETLLSGFIFYPWKDLQIRVFNLADQMKITKAQKERNLTGIIDVIGGTLADDIDVRDLAVADFMYMLYWHRFNSYSSTPFMVSWTSKYGNSNSYKIQDSSLRYDVPTITEDEYVEWNTKGFCIPTVRELEFFNSEELIDDERYLFDRSQYLVGIPGEDGIIDIQNKVDHLNQLCANDLGALETIKEFAGLLNFGVVEQLDLTDAKFDPDKWAESLEQQAEYLRSEAEYLRQTNPGLYVSRMAESDSLLFEAIGIRETLDKGGEVLPDIETISLNIGILDFFPNL